MLWCAFRARFFFFFSLYSCLQRAYPIIVLFMYIFMWIIVISYNGWNWITSYNLQVPFSTVQWVVTMSSLTRHRLVWVNQAETGGTCTLWASSTVWKVPYHYMHSGKTLAKSSKFYLTIACSIWKKLAGLKFAKVFLTVKKYTQSITLSIDVLFDHSHSS